MFAPVYTSLTVIASIALHWIVIVFIVLVIGVDYVVRRPKENSERYNRNGSVAAETIGENQCEISIHSTLYLIGLCHQLLQPVRRRVASCTVQMHATRGSRCCCNALYATRQPCCILNIIQVLAHLICTTLN